MKNKNALKPPARYPSKDAILVAKSRIAYEQEVWHMMHNLINYYKFKEGLPVKNCYSEDYILKQAKNTQKTWNDKLSNWVDAEMWEALVDETHFKTYYIDVLREQHYGRCTGLYDSCDRCEAESKLGITSTVNWTPSQGKYMIDNPDDEYQDSV